MVTKSRLRRGKKNDGLPTVFGRKVKKRHEWVNEERNEWRTGEADDDEEKDEEEQEVKEQTDYPVSNPYGDGVCSWCYCGHRSWFFALGVFIALVYLSGKSHLEKNNMLRKNDDVGKTDVAIVASTFLSMFKTLVSAKDTVPIQTPPTTPPVPVSSPTLPPVPLPVVAEVPAPSPTPVPVPAAADSATVPEVAAVTATTATAASPSFPEKCTNEQMATLAKQLPYTHACRSKSSPNCSIRVATSHAGGCWNGPTLLRQFYASTDFHLEDGQPFTAVMLGLRRNAIGSVVDALSVGSGLDPKYKVADVINNNALGFCSKPIEPKQGNQPRTNPRQVVILDWGSKSHTGVESALQELKKKYGYNDQEILFQRASDGLDFTKVDSYSEILKKAMPIKSKDDVIHYLQVDMGSGVGYGMMMNMIPSLLKNLRFASFEYNKVGDWKNKAHTLINLITKLKENGLVCYWSGTENTGWSLWRITDCFQDYYNYKHWATIDCVSNTHADVGELAARMENQFIETLKKSKTYGDGKRL